jgi:hypothetical protein
VTYIAPTIEVARPVLRRLRMTRSVVIAHLCQEDRAVLAFEGYGFRACPEGWLVWRRPVVGTRADAEEDL